MDALVPCPLCLGVSLLDGAKCGQCNNTGVEHSFIWKDRHMRGRCDGILRPSIFNGLLELKSMNTDRFDGMQGPDHGYIWQAHCYMKAFGFDQTLILYENKNNQSLKEFIIHFDEETWNHINKKIDEINRYVSAHKIPDGECGLTDIDEDCDYSMICRRFYEGK
jgi:hypothetical protein